MPVIKDSAMTIRQAGEKYVTLPQSAIDLVTEPVALAVWVYLLSKSDNWIIRVKDLQERFDIGRDKVHAALKHLREIGLVWDEYQRNEKGNIFGKVIFVSSSPSPESLKTRSSDTESLKNRLTEKPTYGISGHLPNDQVITKVSSNTKVAAKAADVEYPLPDDLNHEAWEEWLAYRRAVGFKAYKKNALSMGKVITNLIKLSGGNKALQMGIVQQSIANQYQGLFPLKGGVPVNYQADSAHWNSREAWEGVF